MKKILLMLLAIINDEPVPQPEKKPKAPKEAVAEQPKETAEQPKEESRPKATKEKKPLESNQIVRAICKHYDLTVEDLKSECKTKYIAKARHVAMYFLRRLTKRSLAEIGFILKRKDHSTILHGVNKMTDMIKTDPDFAAEMEALELEILQSNT